MSVKDYERIKKIVCDTIGEIPTKITEDWLDKKLDEEYFGNWGFTFYDISNCVIDDNLPYELKRRINYSTKTNLGNNKLFDITEEMYKPDNAIVKLHSEGYEGQGMNVAVIDYGIDIIHDEIKDNLVSYTDLCGRKPHFHGVTCASLLCGKNIGVLPKANLHFYQMVEGCSYDTVIQDQNDDIIEALEDIYNRNQNGANIKAVSISTTYHRQDPRYEVIVNKLKEQGCYVIDTIDFAKHYVSIGIDKNRNEYFLSKKYNAIKDKLNRVCALPTGMVLPLYETEHDYRYESSPDASWSTAVLCGLFTLALQIKPDITFDEFNEIAAQNRVIDSNGVGVLDIENTFKRIKELSNNVKLR